MFGFGKFMTRDVIPEWRLSPGPWLLPRDYPMCGNLSYKIWLERWNAAQYAIAESMYSGRPCGEREMAAIARHVTGADGFPQKSEGFAACLYGWLWTFGDGPKLDARGLLWRLRQMIGECDPESALPYDALLPALEDWLVTLSAFRTHNANFDGARLLESAWNRMKAEWPLPSLWPLRFSMRYLLLEHDILLKWEIYALDARMLGWFQSPEFPLSTSFREMMAIVT